MMLNICVASAGTVSNPSYNSWYMDGDDHHDLWGLNTENYSFGMSYDVTEYNVHLIKPKHGYGSTSFQSPFAGWISIFYIHWLNAKYLDE